MKYEPIKCSASELVDGLQAGMTTEECRKVLQGKTMMAAIVMLELDDYFCEKLSEKTTCDNIEQVFLCRLAGAARAWLTDGTSK